MRIVAGAWRGRMLRAPDGQTTRPTSDRLRQALFDMLAHAPWAGHGVLDGARVLDAFAGTGALGLEALSRGAAEAVFMERDRAALAALSANIAACRAEQRARILRCDVTAPQRAPAPCDVVFLDPPYGRGLVEAGLAALDKTGWLRDGALVVAEVAAGDVLAIDAERLAERQHGAGRLVIWRHGASRPAGSLTGL
jgi:16S rRNA (guanine966-N2)-methyltransferase